MFISGTPGVDPDTVQLAGEDAPCSRPFGHQPEGSEPARAQRVVGLLAQAASLGSVARLALRPGRHARTALRSVIEQAGKCLTNAQAAA